VTELDSGGVEVTCPECGALATVRAGRRTAGDFCPSCDYPLFWARPQAVTGPAVRTDDALRRAPGASGSLVPTSLACPECAELNLPSAVVCVRCGAPMTPPPPPPEPPPPAPVVVVHAPPPPPEPCGHPPTWLVVLITAAVTVLLTLWVVWIVATS
jgi:hypothetical protein